jgi:hypothetical protein
MDDKEKLEHSSLVSKVSTELDSRLGINDKDLDEFILALAEKHNLFDEFKTVMLENGEEFSDFLFANLLCLIKHIKLSRGTGGPIYHLPTWKKHITLGSKGASIAKAFNRNQILIVIAEMVVTTYYYHYMFKILSIIVLFLLQDSDETTQITQYLAEWGFTTLGKISCIQPCPVTSMSVVKRVTGECGCHLTQEVDYTICFKNCTSSEIRCMTHGILLCECLINPYLQLSK